MTVPPRVVRRWSARSWIISAFRGMSRGYCGLFLSLTATAQRLFLDVDQEIERLWPPSAAVHPTDQTLQAYGQGKLGASTADSVNQHLESCPDCQRRVGELTSDSFLDRLQDVRDRSDSPVPVSSALAGLSRVTGGPTSGEPPPASSLPSELAGHPEYEVIRELGQGGMGTVYLALNRLTQGRRGAQGRQQPA